MECGWDRLVKQIDTADSLDDVIVAHEEFLSTYNFYREICYEILPFGVNSVIEPLGLVFS